MSAEPQLVHTFVVEVDWYTQFTADPAAEVSDVNASHIFAFSDEDNTFLRFFVFSFDSIVRCDFVYFLSNLLLSIYVYIVV